MAQVFGASVLAIVLAQVFVGRLLAQMFVRRVLAQVWRNSIYVNHVSNMGYCPPLTWTRPGVDLDSD